MSTKFELARGWTVWRQVQLRSAGFPLSDLSALEDLSKFVHDPLVREAVTWQNREVVTHSLDRVEASRGWKKRRRSRVITNYLQRYYAKNEQIGFFGPVAWAQFVDGAGQFEPGQDQLLSRTTHFEMWAVQAWAAYLAEQAEIWPYLRPNLCPELRLSEGAVWGGRGTRNLGCRRRVTPQDYSLLELCNGQHRIRDLDADAVLRFFRQGWIDLVFPLAPDGYPERQLLNYLQELPADCQVFQQQTRHLVQLKDAVSAAAGEAAALYAALERLESYFTETTGIESSRNSGMTYGSRSLVYEDCRRDLKLDIPQALVERMSLPLTGVLLASRWFTFAVASRHLELFEELFDNLSASLGDEIDVSVFNQHLGTLFESECSYLVAPLKDVLAEKWEQVFRGSDHLSDEEFLARCQEVFQAPCPGWPGARHQSPDILYCADDAESFLRGEVTPVLGELHPGVNTWSIYCVYSQHPCPEKLRRQYQDDEIEPGLGPVPWEHVTRCIQDGWLAEGDIHILDHGGVASWREPAQQCRLGDLYLRREGGQLRVFHRSLGWSFSILQLYERDLKLGSCTSFDILGGREASSRVTVGDLVLLRRRAFFEPQSLAFAYQKDAQERDRCCLRFFEGEGFSRHFFAGIQEEKKPIYVDLSSPHLVDLLCKLIRDTKHGLSVTEMLPGPQDLWFSDARKRRYTSELRLIAVDPEPFDPVLVYQGACKGKKST